MLYSVIEYHYDVDFYELETMVRGYTLSMGLYQQQ